MEKEKLNRKIGEWAGFVKGKGIYTFKECCKVIRTNDWWITPEKYGCKGAYQHLPHFLNSFDAHISWTIPKLHKLGYYCHFESKDSGNPNNTYAAIYQPIGFMVATWESETLSEALSLSLEKLINSEVKSKG
jgi:hypothetical protein